MERVTTHTPCQNGLHIAGLDLLVVAAANRGLKEHTNAVRKLGCMHMTEGYSGQYVGLANLVRRR
jgi:hypothetical protein